MITINANTAALVAQNDLAMTQKAMTGNMLQLSTGKRINSAADDAAGLQITNRMQTQINGLGQAQRNATDATSMAQTAEGAMQEVTDILNRMNDLAIQASNDTVGTKEREAIDQEVQQLKSEIGDIASKTNFAGQELFGQSFTFQVGSEAGDDISLNVAAIDTASLSAEVQTYNFAGQTGANVVTLKNDGTNDVVDGDQTLTIEDANGTSTVELKDGTSLADAGTQISDATGLTITLAKNGTTATEGDLTLAAANNDKSTLKSIEGDADKFTVASTEGDKEKTALSTVEMTDRAKASEAQSVIKGALEKIDESRANLGAFQNRMNNKINNMANIQENMSAAQNQMLNADFAKQTTELTSNQMLMQSGATVLSQAKSLPQYATMLMG